MKNLENEVSKPAAESRDSWTIARLLSWAAEDFLQRQFESPRLEAEVLLCATLKLDRVRLITEAQRPLTSVELSTYKVMIQRRRRGEPVAYILGQREFFGRDFLVDSSVLIPRPDTETLLEVAFERTAQRDLEGRALDLCTGSGCVALSFALSRPTWKVTGTDLSEEALNVARKNALRLGALWGVRFVAGNLFEALQAQETFELITANPPYIRQDEVLTLDSGVRDFEPRMAIDGGKSGLDFYPRIVTGSLMHLVPGGVLALEVGDEQASLVEKLLEQAGFTHLARKKDFEGRQRVVSGLR